MYPSREKKIHPIDDLQSLCMRRTYVKLQILTKSLDNTSSNGRIEHNLSRLSNHMQVLISKPETLSYSKKSHPPNHLRFVDF